MVYILQENDASSNGCSHCEEITQELAAVKLAYAEAMNNIECKKKDLREVEEGVTVLYFYNSFVDNFVSLPQNLSVRDTLESAIYCREVVHCLQV